MWLGSASHVVVPSVPLTFTNLYSILVPGARLTVTDHKGLPDVYWAADRGTPFEGDQLPNSGIEPTRKTLSPYAVVTNSSKVTARDVAVAQPEPLFVEEGAVDTAVPAMPSKPVAKKTSP